MNSRQRMFFSVLFTCVMVLGLGSALLASDGNLIKNGGFESVGQDGFPTLFENYEKSPGIIRPDSTVSRSGDYSVVIGGDGENTQAILQKVDISGGKTYRFTVWYRAPELLAAGHNEVPFYARLQLYQSGKWDDILIDPLPIGAEYDYSIKGGTARHLLYIRPYSTTRQDMDDPADWLPLTATFTIPDGQDVRLFISFFNEGTNDSIWIDDMSLEVL